ncbi:unnamed protein product, partial [Owenia fusiformis]
MSTPISDEKTKSKRPKDTKFKQQKLPAWQPILTAGTVLPAFFAIGIAFIPLGVALLITANNVQEKIVEYTTDNCVSLSNPTETCAKFLENKDNVGQMCNCRVTFNLTDDFQGNVFMYYGLSNFYQNHRRYVKSRDDYQLLGKGGAASECEPYRNYQYNDSTPEIPYAPCGAIANSLFNDSFTLTYNAASGDIPVGLNRRGIAWSTDRDVKFRNPPGASLDEAFANTRQPMNWQHNITQLDPDDPDNNGYQNEDLIVWMRTAALPTFRKLYRKINHNSDPVFNGKLPKGQYTLDINY